MYNRIIVLDPERPNFPLPELWVGQGCYGIIIIGNVPDEMTAIKFVPSPVGGGAAVAYAADKSHLVPGRWTVELPAWQFPTSGQADYEILGYVGDKVYGFGSGLLNVYASVMSAEVPDAPQTITDPVVTDPVTGKRWKLIPVVEDGQEPAIGLVEVPE